MNPNQRTMHLKPVKKKKQQLCIVQHLSWKQKSYILYCYE